MRHSRAWHQMHDAALAERLELQELHMPPFLVLTDADREKLRACGTARITELQPGDPAFESFPMDPANADMAELTRHARREIARAFGHQTGSYDDG